MNKKIIGILIIFLLVGCGEKKEVQESPYKPYYEETVAEANTAEENNGEEKSKLKACLGTIKDISESSITIEGIDSKIYTGDPSGFPKLNQGKFVYFEYISYEETEDGYSVEFTLLREQDRKFNGPGDRDEYLSFDDIIILWKTKIVVFTKKGFISS